MCISNSDLNSLNTVIKMGATKKIIIPKLQTNYALL